MPGPAALRVAVVVLLLAVAHGGAHAQGQDTLDIYYLDVEGGGGTLIVSPSGSALLIDAGWPGPRDARRILAAARQAGLARIDYFLATHFHSDHIGAVSEVADALPILNFVDHGEPVEALRGRSAEAYERYLEARAKANHVPVKPGDTLPIAGVNVRVVAAGGDLLEAPLAGAGAPNPLCGDFTPREGEIASDAASVGLFIGFGRFRAVQLGDLTFNEEHDLICPDNVLGTVDVFQMSAHGLNLSSPRELVHALRPRAVVINNAGRKGASRAAWQRVQASPGLEDLWQLHYSEQRPGGDQWAEGAEQGGRDFNVAEQFIANLDDSTAHYIKMSASDDGSFTITNGRTGFTKQYGSRDE
ncbi:MAG: MBL fold metallo-hydrolase [Acidobacteria bacterium]|nr:MBL fold metallo-hydrolase [Acidobacteriota bacterium]